MRTDLLRLLADRLDSMPEEEPLNMGKWMNDCGTAGCAAYYASQIPECQAAGLVKMEGTVENCLARVGSPRLSGDSVVFGYEALERLFGLTATQAQYIFSSCCYNTPKAVAPFVVAHRIRKLIEESQSANSDPVAV